MVDAEGLIAVGAGLAVGLAGIGSGIAEANIGAAAVGAMAVTGLNYNKQMETYTTNLSSVWLSLSYSGSTCKRG